MIMKQFKLFLAAALGIFAPLALHAHEGCQGSQCPAHAHGHTRNEIGVSTGPTYAHEEWVPSIHVHYFRKLSDHSRMSLGAMVEHVWGHDNHLTVGIGIKVEPLRGLSLSVMPGVTLFDHDDNNGSNGNEHDRAFTTHVELVYDLLHFGNFHLGPAICYAFSPTANKHSHLMVGVHLAVCF